jgi:class 3 adenylate cyclase
MIDVVLIILGGIGCIAMMGMAMLAMRWLGRSPRVQRLADRALARLRSQSTIDRMLTWVEAEHPDLERATAPDGTVTLLFSDIEGSTELNERLGDERWFHVLGGHNALVRSEVEKHRGYEVKSQGDGFMIAFPNARSAVQAALGIQHAMESHGQGDRSQQIRVRIGLHTGEAIRREGDFFGKSVTLAARIADQARGGEILVSSLVKELTEARGDIEFDQPRTVSLKGLGDSYRLFPVRHRGGAQVVDLASAKATS